MGSEDQTKSHLSMRVDFGVHSYQLHCIWEQFILSKADVKINEIYIYIYIYLIYFYVSFG